MTEQHTPGPWRICTCDLGYQPLGHRDAEKRIVIRASPSVQANARLIAAAPELLAACIDALEVEENMAQCPDSELAKRLRAAIAKAKGE